MLQTQIPQSQRVCVYSLRFLFFADRSETLFLPLSIGIKWLLYTVAFPSDLSHEQGTLPPFWVKPPEMVVQENPRRSALSETLNTQPQRL